MQFELACKCGQSISDFTRNDSGETSFQVPCDDCGAVYAVTVTQIRDGEA